MTSTPSTRRQLDPTHRLIYAQAKDAGRPSARIVYEFLRYLSQSMMRKDSPEFSKALFVPVAMALKEHGHLAKWGKKGHKTAEKLLKTLMKLGDDCVVVAPPPSRKLRWESKSASQARAARGGAAEAALVMVRLRGHGRAPGGGGPGGGGSPRVARGRGDRPGQEGQKKETGAGTALRPRPRRPPPRRRRLRLRLRTTTTTTICCSWRNNKLRGRRRRRAPAPGRRRPPPRRRAPAKLIPPWPSRARSAAGSFPGAAASSVRISRSSTRAQRRVDLKKCPRAARSSCSGRWPLPRACVSPRTARELSSPAWGRWQRRRSLDAGPAGLSPTSPPMMMMRTTRRRRGGRDAKTRTSRGTPLRIY